MLSLHSNKNLTKNCKQPCITFTLLWYLRVKYLIRCLLLQVILKANISFSFNYPTKLIDINQSVNKFYDLFIIFPSVLFIVQICSWSLETIVLWRWYLKGELRKCCLRVRHCVSLLSLYTSVSNNSSGQSEINCLLGIFSNNERFLSKWFPCLLPHTRKKSCIGHLPCRLCMLFHIWSRDHKRNCWISVPWPFVQLNSCIRSKSHSATALMRKWFCSPLKYISFNKVLIN